MNIEIEGLDELVKALADLGEDAVQKLAPATIEGANIVKEKAKTKIHDVTGDLSKSLKVSKPSKKSKNKYIVMSRVQMGKGGKHGVPLELGHRLWYFGHKTLSDVAPHPFLRPAADESKEEVIGLIVDAMNKTIDEMGGRR